MTTQTAKSAGEPEVAIDTSDLGFLNGLTTAPCFRETALYSIGGGAVLGALHLHRNRTYIDFLLSLITPVCGTANSANSVTPCLVGDVMRSAEIMVKSGCAFAALHW
jgi:hypothetical protein